jgi:hypothetical protein
MKCYECLTEGRERDAVALCHHCSAALCETHLSCLDDPVTATEPLVKVVSLPLRARLFLCATCRAALEQTDGIARAAAGASTMRTDDVPAAKEL